MKQTVSFLFTDIEGSSRLWEQLGDRMGDLLAGHDALARRLVAEHGGVIVKFTGDGVHAAFTDPLPALHCGVQLLVQLRTLEVDAGAVRLKLRAGLHMGPCEARDGDFFGESVNRAARIANSAHGDQFIISDAVAVSLHDAISAPLSLRMLGRIRLRDLSGEETLHQVLHQDLQSDFPPLRSLSQAPNNLPSQRTSFVGRYGELRALAAQLDEHRLVTLVGTGGIGKTRLALQTCARLLDRFEEGVWSVELAGTSDPARVADALLAVWNLAVAPGSTAEDTLCEYLAPRRALLLLDNCEHLIDACARLIDQILRRAPNIKIVATSREPLDVDGELVYRIPGLPLPDPDFEGPVKALCDIEAVRLFVERAQLQLPTWQVVPAEAPMLAALCYRLDGIPLAIELAAARMRDLGLSDILRGLEDRFGFLITGSRVAPPRHKTLAGLIDWSYQLLQPHEQRLFRRLAVFFGGIQAEIAMHTCADQELAADQVDAGLAELANKSLLFRLDANGEVRYGMLETLHQFAAAKLHEANELETMQRDHAHAFGDWAAPLGEVLRGRIVGEVIDKLTRDEENLGRALAFAMSQRDAGSLALSLASSMGVFWYLRGGGKHGADTLRRALQHTTADALSPDRARIEHDLSGLAYMGADMDAAEHHATRARDLARQQGMHGLAARTQCLIAYSIYVRDGYQASRPAFRQAIDDCRASGLDHTRVIAVCNLAINALYAGDRATAQDALNEALRDNDALGSVWVTSSILQVQGLLALDAGQLDEALLAFNDYLRAIVETQETKRQGVAHFCIGKILALMGRTGESLIAFQTAVHMLATSHITLELLNAMEAFAGLLSRRAQWEPACLICAVTATTRERMGYRPGDQAKTARRAALEQADVSLDSQTRARVVGTGQVTSLAATVEWIRAARVERDASGAERIWLPASP